MHLLKQNKLRNLCIVFCMILFTGCSEDGGNSTNIDTTIPENSSWSINTILELPQTQTVPAHITFTHSDNQLYIAYYDNNPLYDINRHDENPYSYRVRYKSFSLSDVSRLSDTNTTTETVALIMDEGSSFGPMSMALSGSTPMLAYGVSESTIYIEGYDFGNQGDVIIAVRDGNDNWRKEIGAIGYNERNLPFANGLAAPSLSLKGDENGNALLSFQFFYEGIDSDNYGYPDLMFISQSIDNFADNNINQFDALEEYVEGSVMQLPTAIQIRAGDFSEMLINQDGNPVIFHYFSNVNVGPNGSIGLRMSIKVDGEWQSEWIDDGVEHSGIEVTQISAAVKSNGLLAIVYTVKDFVDYDFSPNPDNTVTIPYILKYAEQVEVVTGTDTNGEDIIETEWKYDEQDETKLGEIVNYASINGRYCSLAMDSEDNPVVAFFDEMNFTRTRFFSRIKISKRSSGGVWSSETIVPETVGLTIKTSPYDITPGTHNDYYIGKYNYLWLDRNDHINICSYSSVSNKLYHFQLR